MIIDAYTHAMHGDHLDKISTVGGDWTRDRVHKLRESAKFTPQHLDIPLRVEQLEKYGIDLQVVTPSIHVDANLFPGDAAGRLALAAAVNRLAADKGLAARLGDAGYDRARLVTWDGVIEKLVEESGSPESGSPESRSPESR